MLVTLIRNFAKRKSVTRVDGCVRSRTAYIINTLSTNNIRFSIYRYWRNTHYG